VIFHRPAYAGGCDPLTTARIKLAAACATAKYSRGLLTVTSFFFTVHHRWWIRRLALLPVLSSFSLDAVTSVSRMPFPALYLAYAAYSFR
jgi:hypothetical protein